MTKETLQSPDSGHLKIRSARLEQQGEDASFASTSGRQTRPTRTANPPRLRIWKPAQAGEIVAVAVAYLVGSETRVVWTCQCYLDADLILLFEQVQNHAHIKVESSQHDNSPAKSIVIALRGSRSRRDHAPVQATPPAAIHHPAVGTLPKP
jgi:hypothetical protein